MSIQISQFAMMRPIMQPLNLPETAAEVCRDCYVQSTGLDALRACRAVASGFGNCQTLYRIGNQFVAVAQDVSIARSTIIKDLYKRLYFTTAGALYQSTETEFPQATIYGRNLAALLPPDNEFGVGVSAQLMRDGSPVAVYTQDVWERIQSGEVAVRPEPGVVTDPPVIYEDLEKFTAFRVTFVTDRGEETAPSPASDVVGYIDQDNYGFRLRNIPVSSNPWVVKRRVYMAVDGRWFWRTDIDNNVGTSLDLYPLYDDRIGDLLETEDFDPPPANAQGLVAHSNGVLALFFNEGSTGTVCLSVPYQPHAYPVGFRFKSQYPIVALASVPEGLLVLTRGKPMLIVGATPEVMSDHVIESSEACLSKASVLVYNGACFWASPDGIAAFGGSQVQVISRNTWSREQWQALRPATMRMFFYENHLLIYAGSGNAQTAWLYALARHDVGEMSETEARCAWYDVLDDRLYLVRGDTLYAFNEGEPLEAHWLSKPLVLAGAKAMTAARVEAADYPVGWDYFGEALVAMNDAAIQNNKPFRLRSTGRKRWVQVGLATRSQVRWVQLAHDMRAIA